MAHDGFGQLVPQKRRLDQEELSADLGFKAQCLSGHVTDFQYSESSIHCEYEADQQYASGFCEAPWSSATGVPSIICYNEEAEAIARDNSESGYPACSGLGSPAPVEVCYGCVCFTMCSHCNDS